MPPASEVLDRAWHVWPTSDFLDGRRGEPEAARGRIRDRRGSRHRDRAPHGSLARGAACARAARSSSRGRLRPIAIVPVPASSSSASGTAMRIARHRIRRLLPRPRQHRSRACGPCRRRPATRPRCCTSAARNASPHLLACRAPVDRRRAAHRALDRPRPGRHLRVRRRRATGSGATSGPCRASSSYPEMYAGILFLGLLGYVLNRLFLVVERRVLAWHYGAAGEPAR